MCLCVHVWPSLSHTQAQTHTLTDTHTNTHTHARARTDTPPLSLSTSPQQMHNKPLSTQSSRGHLLGQLLRPAPSAPPFATQGQSCFRAAHLEAKRAQHNIVTLVLLYHRQISTHGPCLPPMNDDPAFERALLSHDTQFSNVCERVTSKRTSTRFTSSSCLRERERERQRG